MGARTRLQVLKERLEGEAQKHAAGSSILCALHAVGHQLAGILSDMHAMLWPCGMTSDITHTHAICCCLHICLSVTVQHCSMCPVVFDACMLYHEHQQRDHPLLPQWKGQSATDGSLLFSA